MDSYRFGCAMAGYTPILPKCNKNTTGEQNEFFFDQVSIMRDAVLEKIGREEEEQPNFNDVPAKTISVWKKNILSDNSKSGLKVVSENNILLSSM